MKHPTLIINGLSASAGNVARCFQKHQIPYVVSETRREMAELLQRDIQRKQFDFLICGGDGTINSFLQIYMCFPARIRRKVRVGFVPAGKANDFVRFMHIPLEPLQAYRQLMRRKARRVDLVDVNGKYFLTGGGIGFPADVVSDVDRFVASRTGGVLGARMKDAVYYLFVLKRLIFGYNDVICRKAKGKPDDLLMLFAVQNQPFIGKRFHLAPKARNDDGVFDATIIKKPGGRISTYRVVRTVVRGEAPAEATYLRAKTLKIRTTQKMHFMADGELLVNGDSFTIRICPGELTVFS